MFLLLAIVLVVMWGVGSLAFHAAGALIHLALALALVSALVHFVAGRGPGARV
jgi:hypothetical protein